MVTNPNVASFFGFAQGFDAYMELYEQENAHFVDAKQLVADAELVNERAIEWIDGSPFPRPRPPRDLMDGEVGEEHDHDHDRE